VLIALRRDKAGEMSHGRAGLIPGGRTNPVVHAQANDNQPEGKDGLHRR
jgi:hypothetical protein